MSELLGKHYREHTITTSQWLQNINVFKAIINIFLYFVNKSQFLMLKMYRNAVKEMLCLSLDLK